MTGRDYRSVIASLSPCDGLCASEQLANLIRDADPKVAERAVQMADRANGGPEVDRSLIAIVGDPNADADLRTMAARQLRSRDATLDERAEAVVDELVGPEIIAPRPHPHFTFSPAQFRRMRCL